MNLHQLSRFVAVAETGNFRRAAEQLHIAQPPLSVSIRKLEDELGSSLFERTTKGVLLTPAGQSMLEDARRVLQHAQQCLLAVREVREGTGGRLRLGLIGSATYALLPKLIPSVRARYPRIELELTDATTSEILEGLASRRFDAGLVRSPLLDPSGFDLLPLDLDDFVLVVAAGSPLSTRDTIALHDAAREPFIMYRRTKSPNLFAHAVMRCQLSGFSPRVAQEAMQVQTIMSLVASGLGVGLVAEVARHMMPDGVKCLRLTDNPPGFHTSISLVRLAGDTSRLVQRFFEHALDFVKEQREVGGVMAKSNCLPDP